METINGSEANFLNRKAWTKIPRDKADREKKILKVKWVFKKKDEQDGTQIQIKDSDKGYQIPGVTDYRVAPVATDTTTFVTHNCFL
jgi:hypothetical protein